jgi:hypothetical protein
MYVVPFPGPGGKTRISMDGGKFPIWSRNRRELFFLDFASNPRRRRFAAVLHADGTAERNPVTSLTFLLNFFDEPRRRVPTQ